MTQTNFNKKLLAFLKSSTTPFHACKTMIQDLKGSGFIQLLESQRWDLVKGNKYYVTRNDSSIIAFIYGSDNLSEKGLSMVGAHTDSPCLKLKPNAIIQKKNYIQLGVEVYGSALLNPLFLLF